MPGTWQVSRPGHYAGNKEFSEVLRSANFTTLGGNFLIIAHLSASFKADKSVNTQATKAVIAWREIGIDGRDAQTYSKIDRNHLTWYSICP